MEDAKIIKTYCFDEGKVFLCSNSFANTDEERDKVLKNIQICANKILNTIILEQNNAI